MKASTLRPERIDWKAERDRIDLAAVVTRHLGPAPGRRGGAGRLSWLCPFHDDRNPSFSVKGNRWYCFACAVGGDAIEFIKRLEACDFLEAVAILTGGAPPKSPRPARKAPREPCAQNSRPEPSGMSEADALALVEEAAARLWTPEGADALAYLTGPKRCLAPETIRAARLGWTPRADRECRGSRPGLSSRGSSATGWRWSRSDPMRRWRDRPPGQETPPEVRGSVPRSGPPRLLPEPRSGSPRPSARGGGRGV